MSAKIYEMSPKGSAWLVFHREWKGGGSTTNWAFVFNYGSGLTAKEAWQHANLDGNPPFHEVLFEQLDPFPCERSVSASTKGLGERAAAAFEKLRERVKNNPNTPGLAG